MATYSFTDVSSSKKTEDPKKKSRIILLTIVIIIAILAVVFLVLQNVSKQPQVPQEPGLPAAENTIAEEAAAADPGEVVLTAASVETVEAPAGDAGNAAGAVAADVAADIVAEVAADAAGEVASGTQAAVAGETAADAGVVSEQVELPAPENIAIVVPEVVAEPVENVSVALAEGLAEAKELLDYRRYQEGHAALAALLAAEDISSCPKFRDEVISELNSAAKAFGKAVHTDKITHVISSGDNLDRLARRNNATIEAIALLNGITDHNRIMLGYDLTILPGPWKAVVDLAACEVTLYRNDAVFMVFEAGVGKGRLTPKGTFAVADRVVEPTWTVGNEEIPYGDPRNIIGTRWMPLKATGNTPPVDGIGIHGTNDNSTIGKSSSNGCIRLSNNDVEELYMLLPVNSEVIIR